MKSSLGCFRIFVVIVLAIITAFFIITGGCAALWGLSANEIESQREKARESRVEREKQRKDAEILKSTPFD